MFIIPCWDAGKYVVCHPSPVRTWQFWADGGLLVLYLVIAVIVLLVVVRVHDRWRARYPLTPDQQAGRQAHARQRESIRIEAARLNAAQSRRHAVARERRRQRRGPWL